MKGITLTFNGQEIKAGSHAGIIISNKESDLHIMFAGCDKERSYTYFRQSLKAGDDIFIKYGELTESEMSSPARIMDYGNPEELKRSMLEEYHRLRQELVDEGLIKI